MSLSGSWPAQGWISALPKRTQKKDASKRLWVDHHYRLEPLLLQEEEEALSQS